MVVNFICSLFAFWYVCVIDDLVTLRNCDLVASLDTSIYHYIWTCLSISELRVSLAPLKWFKPSNKYFTDRSKAVLLLWIFYVFFCLVFAMCLCAAVYMCFVITCWEKLTSWLSFVLSGCEFFTFPFDRLLL